MKDLAGFKCAVFCRKAAKFKFPAALKWISLQGLGLNLHL